jgi:hypothetical protein
MVSDDLIVSGGGSVIVASDDLLARIDKVSKLGGAFRSAAHELGVLLASGHSSMGQVPAAGREAREQLESAIALSHATANRAALAYGGLRTCLEAYAATEAAVERANRGLIGQFAWVLGRVTPLVLVPIAMGLAVDEAILQGVFHLTPKQQANAARALLRGHNAPMTNPATVRALKEVMMATDDFGEGLIGVPPSLPRVLGDQGLGLLGVPSSAATVAAIGGAVGLLRETDVAVRRSGAEATVAPVDGIRDRAGRIPVVTEHGNQAQVRIDRYSAPGKPDSFDVYIGGTASFALKTGQQPFDFTSDIVGVAQESPASARAVVQAMREAGVTPNSPVLLNGYSQGGLLASLIAASGDFNVKGVVTLGAPSGQVPIPDGVPVLALRHSEDIVPATGGDDRTLQAVVVQRSLFDDQPIPGGVAVPAHALRYYEQTAELVDHAQSDELRAVVAGIDTFGSDATAVTSARWQATRVQAGATSGP